MSRRPKRPAPLPPPRNVRYSRRALRQLSAMGVGGYASSLTGQYIPRPEEWPAEPVSITRGLATGIRQGALAALGKPTPIRK